MENCYAFYVGYSGFDESKSGGYTPKNGIAITDGHIIQLNIDTNTMMFNSTGQLQAKTQLQSGDGILIDGDGKIAVAISKNETLKLV